MDANAVLIVVAIALVGSAIWGWRSNRQKRGAGRKQRGELLSIEGGGMFPTIPSVMKVMTLDGVRSIDPVDIGHVKPHRRDGGTCYATLMLRSSEKLTGLVATADIDALLSDRLARRHAKTIQPKPHLVHWQVSTREQGTLTETYGESGEFLFTRVTARGPTLQTKSPARDGAEFTIREASNTEAP